MGKHSLLSPCPLDCLCQFLFSLGFQEPALQPVTLDLGSLRQILFCSTDHRPHGPLNSGTSDRPYYQGRLSSSYSSQDMVAKNHLYRLLPTATGGRKNRLERFINKNLKHSPVSAPSQMKRQSWEEIQEGRSASLLDRTETRTQNRA